MFSTLIKLFLLIFAVLLLGQIPYEGKTIGAQFFSYIQKSMREGSESIRKAPMVASLSKKISDFKISAGETETEEDLKPDEASEKYSSSDRESLIRLLQ